VPLSDPANPQHWSDKHFAYIQGFKGGTFRLEQTMTRAEAAALLAGLVDDYTDKGAYRCDYVDVARDAAYYDDLAYMQKKGFVSSDGNRFSRRMRSHAANSLTL